MMDERLRLARGLLSKDGVIFVSIDDTEHARLRSLLDYNLGDTNFVDLPICFLAVLKHKVATQTPIMTHAGRGLPVTWLPEITIRKVSTLSPALRVAKISNPVGTDWRVSPSKFYELDSEDRIWWR